MDRNNLLVLTQVVERVCSLTPAEAARKAGELLDEYSFRPGGYGFVEAAGSILEAIEDEGDLRAALEAATEDRTTL